MSDMGSCVCVHILIIQCPLRDTTMYRRGKYLCRVCSILFFLSCSHSNDMCKENGSLRNHVKKRQTCTLTFEQFQLIAIMLSYHVLPTMSFVKLPGISKFRRSSLVVPWISQDSYFIGATTVKIMVGWGASTRDGHQLVPWTGRYIRLS